MSAFLGLFYKLRLMLKSLISQACAKEPNLQLYLSASEDKESLKTIILALAEHQLDIVCVQDVHLGWKLALAGEQQNIQALNKQFRLISEQTDVDIAFVATNPIPSLSQAGILFMDMDSTLIQCECIDEIADFLGIKEKISAITKSAMEGKLDFSASLIARVKLLAGLEESVLKQVYDERICLTDGAEALIQTVHKAGWKVGLVSGGFTYFTGLLEKRLNLDFTRANSLEIIDGKLTGRVLGAIVDAQMKKELLIKQSEAWGIDLAHTVALGDGANDLPMLATAGIGIAFHAKPQVRTLAPFALSSGGLDQTLHLLTPMIREEV